jgi:hypothetical protein
MNMIYLQSTDMAERTRGICTSQPIDSKIVYFTPGERNGRACHRVCSNGSQGNPRATRTLPGIGRLLIRDIGSVSPTSKPPVEFGRTEGDLVMTRIMAVVLISGVMAMIVVWSNVVQVKPEVAATLTESRAEEGRAMISPLEIMMIHGKNAPVEDWRDAI